MDDAASEPEAGPLAIICGGGALPYAVADAAIGRGRRIVMFALRGFADPIRVADYPHRWMSIGQYGGFTRGFRAEGCHDVVFIGSVVRPSLRHLRFDFGTLMIVRRLAALFRGGDNHLLSGLVRLLEEDGFRVLGAHEIAPQLLMPAGILGRIAPVDRDRDDITRGLALIAATGAFDVGQAVIVANNHVLAVEAIEGTDQMLERIADLRRSGRLRTPTGIGVLVKGPKAGQERRIDLPSIGPQTVEAAARAGLAGVAVVAGGAIVADAAAISQAADAGGVFVIGVPATPAGEPP